MNCNSTGVGKTVPGSAPIDEIGDHIDARAVKDFDANGRVSVERRHPGPAADLVVRDSSPSVLRERAGVYGDACRASRGSERKDAHTRAAVDYVVVNVRTACGLGHEDALAARSGDAVARSARDIVFREL